MSGTLGLNILSALGALSGTASFRLGSVSFTGHEVPSALRYGGVQSLYVERQPGGGKLISALGSYDDPLSWTGTFLGGGSLARGRTLDAMRKSGRVFSFTGAGLSLQVVVSKFWTDYSAQGGVIPYAIECEIIPPAARSSSGLKSALASLIGSDAANAITSVQSAVSKAAGYVSDFTGAASMYLGQVTPLASLLGVGGPLTRAAAGLSGISGLSGGAASLVSPEATQTLIGGLQSAGQSVQAAVQSMGSELTSIGSAAGSSLFGSSSALAAASGNASALASAVDAGGSINRAITNANSSLGQAATAPVVHS